MFWNEDKAQWNEALNYYPSVVEGLESSSARKTGLRELENFVWNELGSELEKRDPPHLLASEYQRVVAWKLKRGKWRPKLQHYADSIDDSRLRSTTESAFSALDNADTGKALTNLTKLKGCGPATASAVLAAYSKEVPFMSDELLVAVPCFSGKREYTAKVFRTLIEQVNEKVCALNKGDGKNDWNARDVERAAFVHSVASYLGMSFCSIPGAHERSKEGESQNQLGSPKKEEKRIGLKRGTSAKSGDNMSLVEEFPRRRSTRRRTS